MPPAGNGASVMPPHATRPPQHVQQYHGLGNSPGNVPPPQKAHAPPPGPAGEVALHAELEKEREKEKARREREREKREKEERKRKVQKEEERKRAKRLEAIPASSDPAVAKRLEQGLFLAPYSFDNPLPQVPVDPKLLSLTFNKDKFVRFRYDSSAEMGHRYEMLAEPDLGITIDLVDPQAYDQVPGTELDPADAELLSASALGKAIGEQPHSSSTVKQMRSEVTWLRKTPLMGNNLYDAIHKHKKEQVETKHVVKETKALALEKEKGIGARSLQDRIDKIEATFNDAAALSASSLQHPNDPTLSCVSLLPLLPDFDCWPNSYVLLQFDCDPALEHVTDAQPKFAAERVSQAVVKGFSQPGNAQSTPTPYLAYMLPAEGSSEGEEAEPRAENEVGLDWVREYAYEVKQGQESDSYFLVVSESAVSYNEFTSKIAANRKAFRRIDARPTSVTLARREADEKEEEEQRARVQRLLIEGPRLLTHRT